jgi:hypothetical protein
MFFSWFLQAAGCQLFHSMAAAGVALYLLMWLSIWSDLNMCQMHHCSCCCVALYTVTEVLRRKDALASAL